MANFIASTDLFNMAEQYPFSDVHFWRDPETQLQAIIAIHSTQLGPVGGCRMIDYSSTHDAVKDACWLAAGMSYKTTINRQPFGGGKAVILKPKILIDRQALFSQAKRQNSSTVDVANYLAEQILTSSFVGANYE